MVAQIVARAASRGRKQRPHASGSDFAKAGGRFSRDKKIATALAQCRLLGFSF